MGYNRAKKKMKKTLLTIGMFAILATSAIMFSAFTTPKHETRTECSQNEMGDPWKKMRSGVAICNGDTDACMGTGDIYVNEDTKQVKIRVRTFGTATFSDKSNYDYDLTVYTGKDGYNMRFWYEGQYCYVMVS